MTIQGVRAGTIREFSQEELEALRHEASSSAVLNKARHDAGDKGRDVSVRGDDGTLASKLADNQTHMSWGKIIGTACEGVHLAEALGVPKALGLHAATAVASRAAAAPVVALAITSFVGTQVAMAEMQKVKDETRDAATRDVMHGALLLSLELPSSFRDHEIGKLGITTTNQSPATKIASQICGTPMAATLQHQCDQGVHAAEDARSSGMSRETFFKACPAIANRYASDAAFKAGFDAYEHAATNAPGDAAAMRTNIEARDARYQSAGVPVKG